METLLTKLSSTAQKAIATILILISFTVVVFSAYTFLPVDVEWQRDGPPSVGVDWKGAFRPATLALLHGENPYEHSAFSPPWIYALLIPVAVLPAPLGAAVMYALGLFMFAFAAFRFSGKPWMALAILALPFVWQNANNGNIDWMIALGATLPPQIGLFLVLAKPQISAGLMLFWGVEAWRQGGWKEAVRTFGPVSAALLLSFALYGLWPLKAGRLVDVWWNASLWPASIPIGFALLFSALRSRKSDLAISASPFLSPYLTEHSWGLAVFGLL